MAASAPVGFNSAAVVHLNGTRQPIHRATQAYRGECAFSPPVPPVHPQPFSLLAKGSSCPSTYSVLGGVNKGSGSAVTRSFTPGKALAKAALGSLQGVRNYLAENGAVNAQLDVGELLVLDREVATLSLFFSCCANSRDICAIFLESPSRDIWDTLCLPSRETTNTKWCSPRAPSMHRS